MPAELSAQIAEFCAGLRRDCGFRLGIAEVRDALRAVLVTGVADRRQFRTSLRTVLCGRFEDLAAFDVAFDRFFTAHDDRGRKVAPRPRLQAVVLDPPDSNSDSDRLEWDALVAKYSANAGQRTPPQIPRNEPEIGRNARALLHAIRLGRSRRWTRAPRGPRFDARRTMRESLQLGGEPLRLRRLGHPLRNPRVIVLIDGSRSMTEHANDVLGFADALVRRSLRARVFAFSTEVRDITHDVRRGALPQLGPAWGGGTRIGESFRSFVRRYGAVLDDNTVVLVFSDGLDFGDCNVVANAAQTLRRRSAALVWLSPNAGVPGYVPATQAMRAVLPSLTALVGASEFRKLVRIAQRL